MEMRRGRGDERRRQGRGVAARAQRQCEIRDEHEEQRHGEEIEQTAHGGYAGRRRELRWSFFIASLIARDDARFNCVAGRRPTPGQCAGCAAAPGCGFVMTKRSGTGAMKMTPMTQKLWLVDSIAACF